MKDYLKKHETQAAYTAWAASENYIEPNVSLIEATNEITYNPYVVPVTPAHEYVEIGGIKWATMNVGANSITDYGLYFQWGDSSGYTAAQVGSGSGKKAFTWADYKYSNNGGSTAADMTKYNSTDGKTVLDIEDDGVAANWGGKWRMPTTEELVTLRDAVTTEWVSNYEGSGVAGLVCTDKTDSSKKLFFPAAGYCYNGSMYDVGSYGNYWSSSLGSSNVQRANYLDFRNGNVNWQSNSYRRLGLSLRGVVGE